MFLGEHQHSLDAKGRVILPARFRDQLEDGAVMAKALDVPLVRQWWVGTGKGQLEFQDLKLTDNRELLSNNYPRSLAGRIPSRYRGVSFERAPVTPASAFWENPAHARLSRLRPCRVRAQAASDRLADGQRAARVMVQVHWLRPATIRCKRESRHPREHARNRPDRR